MLRPVYHKMKSVEYFARNSFGLVESEDKLVRDSQEFWNKDGSDLHKYTSHWRGGGVFKDDEQWLRIGKNHLAIFEMFARAIDLQRPIKRIVEWGCGGGANAVAFAPNCDEFVGVDIAQSSLDECGKQLASFGNQNFKPVLIDAARPEASVSQIDPCDVFLCVYVFEALPTPEYALRILKLAHTLLRDGGLAMIQVKYPSTSASTRSRRWNYAKNLANNVTFTIEEFWIEAEKCGFTPKLVHVVPKVEAVHDERYAYFALTR
jgi:SAM-dependent methyltransferase